MVARTRAAQSLTALAVGCGDAVTLRTGDAVALAVGVAATVGVGVAGSVGEGALTAGAQAAEKSAIAMRQLRIFRPYRGLPGWPKTC
jgi:hypothetical protein